MILDALKKRLYQKEEKHPDRWLKELLAIVLRTSLLHHIQAKERRRSSMGVQFIFLMVEAQSN